MVDMDWASRELCPCAHGRTDNRTHPTASIATRGEGAYPPTFATETVAQLVEHRVVVPAVAGSIPVGLPSPPSLPTSRADGGPNRPVKAFAIQADIAWEDKAANRAAFEARVRGESPPPGSLVVLPELCDVGFTMNSARAAEDDSRSWASALARSLGIWLVSGLAVRHERGVSNCAVVHDPAGREAALYRKAFLFTPAGEREHYVPGSASVTVDCGGIRIAPVICYDLRFPELWRRAALDGAHCFVCIASWPSVRQRHWDTLLVARAVENQAFVIGCNRTGRDPSSEYAGGSMIVNPLGEVLSHAGAGPGTASADIDAPAVSQWRARFPALADARLDIGIDRR